MFVEALAMRAARAALPADQVPVPELFGWRVSEGENFIYMSFVQRRTAHMAWPHFTLPEKESFCERLGRVVTSIQSLRQDRPDPFIGTLTWKLPRRTW